LNNSFSTIHSNKREKTVSANLIQTQSSVKTTEESNSTLLIDSKKKTNNRPLLRIKASNCRSYSKIDKNSTMNSFAQAILRSRSEIDLANVLDSNMILNTNLIPKSPIDKVKFRNRILQKENLSVHNTKSANIAYKTHRISNDSNDGIMTKSLANPYDSESQTTTFKSKPIIKTTQNQHTSTISHMDNRKTNNDTNYRISDYFTKPIEQAIPKNFKGSDYTDSGIGNGSSNDANSHRSSIFSQASFDSLANNSHAKQPNVVLTTFISKKQFPRDSNSNSKLNFAVSLFL
jgi:hypothetical protein